MRAASGDPFADLVADHVRRLSRRSRGSTNVLRHVLDAEVTPPTGQAALWYADVVRLAPRSGQHVAEQLARLCGEDSMVTIPWRSLADAVGRVDAAGRHIAYAQRGVQALAQSGWLGVETVGRGRAAVTTFYLEPGDRFDFLAFEDDPTEDEPLAA